LSSHISDTVNNIRHELAQMSDRTMKAIALKLVDTWSKMAALRDFMLDAGIQERIWGEVDMLANELGAYMFALSRTESHPELASQTFMADSALQGMAQRWARASDTRSDLARLVKKSNGPVGEPLSWSTAQRASAPAAPRAVPPVGAPQQQQPQQQPPAGALGAPLRRRAVPGAVTASGHTLKCFNCGGADHFTQRCAKPVDQKRIDTAREAFLQTKRGPAPA
jgi:hypothetical protein